MSTRNAALEDANRAMTTATLKLPEFYRHRPEVWFHFVEAQFLLRNITDDQVKFAHVVISLHPDVSALISDSISPPPAENQYNTIKARLLKEFTLSPAERASQLLSMPGLGDQRPSQLLSQMLALLPANKQAEPGILFKELFLCQLPADFRPHLADKYNLDVRALAKEADHFFSITGSRVSAVRAAPPSTTSTRGRHCFYHTKYGDQAKKCQSPCSYRPGN